MEITKARLEKIRESMAHGFHWIVRDEYGAIIDLALSELSRREDEAGEVVVEGYVVSDWRDIPMASLWVIREERCTDTDEHVTVTIRRRAEQAKGG